MDASAYLDQITPLRHTKVKMAVDPGEILVPKPERSSILQVGFEASPRLNDALHRFLLPDHTRREFIFRTQLSRRLMYSDSNNDGVRYHPAEAAQLAEDKDRLRTLGSLPVGIWRAETGQSSRTGDVQVQLELQPTRLQRQLLGGFVLQGLATSPEEKLLVYTRLAHHSLKPLEGVARAAFMLEHDLGMHEADRPPIVRPSALYVANPYITERTGDIHVVPPS